MTEIKSTTRMAIIADKMEKSSCINNIEVENMLEKIERQNDINTLYRIMFVRNFPTIWFEKANSILSSDKKYFERMDWGQVWRPFCSNLKNTNNHHELSYRAQNLRWMMERGENLMDDHRDEIMVEFIIKNTNIEDIASFINKFSHPKSSWNAYIFLFMAVCKERYSKLINLFPQRESDAIKNSFAGSKIFSIISYAVKNGHTDVLDAIGSNHSYIFSILYKFIFEQEDLCSKDKVSDVIKNKEILSFSAPYFTIEQCEEISKICSDNSIIPIGIKSRLDKYAFEKNLKENIEKKDKTGPNSSIIQTYSKKI